MENKYILVTEAEYAELINVINFGLEVGYADILERVSETTAALNAIDSILNIVAKEQIYRKKEV